MFYALRKKLKAKYFDFHVKAIKEKANVVLNPDSKLTVVTLLQNIDVSMYLLAIASFCRYVTPKRVVIVSDNLNEKNKAIIKKCIKDVEIYPVTDFRVKGLPRGGCWERLTCIVQNTCNSYVIQLDADTLTLRPPEEVVAAIESNTAFTLLSNPTASVMSLADVASLVSGWGQDHIQVVAEKTLDTLNNAAGRNYVRGCAAFTGFPKGDATGLLHQLTGFSSEMADRIGFEKWSEWGSEQVASNYLIANQESPVLLPFEDYPFYNPARNIDYRKTRFCHFIGSNRYDNGFYKTLAKNMMASLT